MKIELQRGLLRKAIAQWILVRTFGYATTLLRKVENDALARPSAIELVRGVVTALYRQIQVLSYPTYTDSPTTKRFMNQWP